MTQRETFTIAKKLYNPSFWRDLEIYFSHFSILSFHFTASVSRFIRKISAYEVKSWCIPFLSILEYAT